MKKFEIVNLEDLPKGARFYFLGDGRKKIYEVKHQNNADTDFIYVAKNVKRTIRTKNFHSSPEKQFSFYWWRDDYNVLHLQSLRSFFTRYRCIQFSRCKHGINTAEPFVITTIAHHCGTGWTQVVEKI